MPRFSRRPLRRLRRRRRTHRGRRRTRRFAGRAVHFKRSTFIEEISVSAATDVKKHYTVAGINALQNSGDFTNLFDAYRINKVVYRILPSHNVSTGATGNWPPNVITVVDYNDVNAQASPSFTVAELLEYRTHRIHRGFGIVSRKFTPAVAIGVSSGGAVVAGVQKFKQWLDVATPAVAHGSLKVLFDTQPGNTQTYNYTVYRDIYFSCKQVK